jgi:competence protein ComEA
LTTSKVLSDTKDPNNNQESHAMIKKLLILATVLFSINAFAAPVNINTADAQTIADSLNGIGIKKAQTIVDFRAKNGDFKTIDDLAKVSGIGAKTIEKNKADILLSDTVTPAATTPATTDTSKQPTVDKPSAKTK